MEHKDVSVDDDTDGQEAVAENMEGGEEHDDTGGDVGIHIEVVDRDDAHVDDAEAAVEDDEVVQEGAVLMLGSEEDQGRVGGHHQHRCQIPQHLEIIFVHKISRKLSHKHSSEKVPFIPFSFLESPTTAVTW